MYKIEAINRTETDAIMSLFYESFADDNYYKKLFPNRKPTYEDMYNQFVDSVNYCIENGISYCIKKDQKIIAFIICFDYFKVKSNDIGTFNTIFSGSADNYEIPYNENLHGLLAKKSEKLLYCLSIAVSKEERNCGLASCLIDKILSQYKDFSLAADVSNDKSLSIYLKRRFKVKEIDEGYYLVYHNSTDSTHSFNFNETISMLVPDEEVLQKANIKYEVIKAKTFVWGFDYIDNLDCKLFSDISETDKANVVVCGVLVKLSYKEYLKFQKFLNVSHYVEKFIGDSVCLVSSTVNCGFNLVNDVLSEMLEYRKLEWSIVPDIYVSVPMICEDDTRIKNCKSYDEKAAFLLKELDYRTHYETGVPSQFSNVDNYSSFKSRIKRYYLGKVEARILSEITLDNYLFSGDVIGSPAMIDIYISLDLNSKCAVLTWYSLSCPFLFSHYLDNVIRNQLIISDNGKLFNLYDWLYEKFGIVKCGTPKIFATIPENKLVLPQAYIASLLAGETIYPEGETFGRIIDEDILSVINSSTGMGQYDRGIVYAYTNVLLQFDEDSRASIMERLNEESITLFYIELTLLEEASIHLTDSAIIKLLSTCDVEEPVKFLKQVEKIHDDYSKTIDFWNVQVNYPTSQKSINMMRAAFKIDEQLLYMKRNQEQLQTVFNTKCDIVDRKNSKRVETSLAIISVLAIFSAWIDGHQYIAEWSKLMSQGVIGGLQIGLFFLILCIGIYVIIRLSGKSILFLWRSVWKKIKITVNNKKKKRD